MSAAHPPIAWQVVLAAAYAPLLVNDNARPWPTNLIVFDSHR